MRHKHSNTHRLNCYENVILPRKLNSSFCNVSQGMVFHIYIAYMQIYQATFYCLFFNNLHEHLLLLSILWQKNVISSNFTLAQIQSSMKILEMKIYKTMSFLCSDVIEFLFVKLPHPRVSIFQLGNVSHQGV